MNSFFFVVFLSLFFAGNVSAAQVEVNDPILLGNFSNRDCSKPGPCLGDSIELWKGKEGIFGYFYHTEGPANYAIGGQISKASYSSTTGKLEFKVTGESKWFFNKEDYKFEGILIDDVISGVLKSERPLYGGRSQPSEKFTRYIVLKKITLPL